MVEFLCVKRSEIEPIFTEGFQECASLVYNMEVLKHFGTKNCVRIFLSDFLVKLDIVQNLYKFWAQNISILPDQKKSQRGKMFQNHHIVYYFRGLSII